MTIQSELLKGKKIRFFFTDEDVWSFDQDNNLMYQWVNGELTGSSLNVILLEEDNLTIDWNGSTSTLHLSDVQVED